MSDKPTDIGDALESVDEHATDPEGTAELTPRADATGATEPAQPPAGRRYVDKAATASAIVKALAAAKSAKPAAHPEPVDQPESAAHAGPVDQPATYPDPVVQPEPVAHPEPLEQRESAALPEPVDEPDPTVEAPVPVPAVVDVQPAETYPAPVVWPTPVDETTTRPTPAPGASGRPPVGARVRHPVTAVVGAEVAPPAAPVDRPMSAYAPEPVPAEEPPVEGAAADAGGSGRRRRAAIIGGAVVGALVLLYGIAYLIAGDTLARGSTVAGVEVGGLTEAQAQAELEAQLPAIVDVPILVSVDGHDATFEIVPSGAGLRVDVPATVNAVPGGSANPISLVKALLGGGEVEPVPMVDTAALTTAVTAIADESATEAVNGAVAFDEGTVVTSEPVVGHGVDVEAGSAALQDAYFGGDGVTELPIGDIALPVVEVQPAVTGEEVARAVAEFAEPAMSAPVTVVAGDKSATLSPEIIGEALALTPDEAGSLQPVLDPTKLAEVAHEELADIGQEGNDATIRIEGGAPVIVPGEMGQGVEPEALSAAVLPALTAQGDERTAEVTLTNVAPKLSTDDAEALGVKEVVGEFSTYFPHADYRNVNIGTAAERIDNTLLLPGEVFSLNGIVGERTEANGFTAGTIISGGRLQEELGGGVSQVATTTFHAAFQAGLEDVEHWPHSIYFDRYPIGQEATVAWGAKDMRFKNDTPNGVVVETRFSPSSPGSRGALTVRIWSTEYYKVETSVSDRYDFTSPRTIYDTSEECLAQGGSQGFSITSYRKVWTLDGTLVKDEQDPWTYNPNHKVICGPEPATPGNG